MCTCIINVNIDKPVKHYLYCTCINKYICMLAMIYSFSASIAKGKLLHYQTMMGPKKRPADRPVSTPTTSATTTQNASEALNVHYSNSSCIY